MFDRRRRVDRGEVLDVGGDDDGFEIDQLETAVVALGEKVDQRPVVRLPRVAVPDVGSEEFEEPLRRTSARIGNDRRRTRPARRRRRPFNDNRQVLFVRHPASRLVNHNVLYVPQAVVEQPNIQNRPQQ